MTMNPFAEPWPALWFVLIVPPQGELAATAWLAREGVAEAWGPTEIVHVRQPRPPHKWIPRVKPIATGYLFARLPRRPIWPFLFDQSRGKITDVLRIGEMPVALADADLLQMREVPERLRHMREAAKEAATVRPGDTVTVTAGTLAGWQVTVDSVHGNVARISAPLLGKLPVVEVSKLAKGAA